MKTCPACARPCNDAVCSHCGHIGAALHPHDAHQHDAELQDDGPPADEQPGVSDHLDSSVAAMLEDLRGLSDDPRIHLHPDIPDKLLAKALGSYGAAAAADAEPVLCVADNSLVMRNAGSGVLITQHSLYYRSISSKPYTAAVSLESLASVDAHTRMLSRSLLLKDVLDRQFSIALPMLTPAGINCLKRLITSLLPGSMQPAARPALATTVRAVRSAKKAKRPPPDLKDNLKRASGGLAVVAIIIVLAILFPGEPSLQGKCRIVPHLTTDKVLCVEYHVRPTGGLWAVDVSMEAAEMYSSLLPLIKDRPPSPMVLEFRYPTSSLLNEYGERVQEPYLPLGNVVLSSEDVTNIHRYVDSIAFAHGQIGAKIRAALLRSLHSTGFGQDATDGMK